MAQSCFTSMFWGPRYWRSLDLPDANHSNRSRPASPPWPCSEALFGLQQL